MGANVTVRGKFLDDARADVLGQLLGIDPDLARMRMIRLWSWMTDHRKSDAAGGIVDEVQLIGRFGPDGPAHLVRAKLAREVEPGRYYICGANGDDEGKSDLGWLERKRTAGGKGGSERAARASDRQVAKASDSGTHQAPSKHETSTGQAPAKHDAGTDEAKPNPQDPGSGIRDPNEEQTESVGFALAHPDPPRPKADLVAGLWAEQERLRADSIPGSRPLKLTRDRRKLVQARLDDGYTVEDLRVSLVFRATRAKLGDSEWFNGDANWSAKSVAYALGQQGTAARGRDGPAGPPVGQGRPTHEHGIGTIDPRSL